MTSQEREERVAAKQALQDAKYMCVGYFDIKSIAAERALEDRFDKLARDLGLGDLEQ